LRGNLAGDNFFKQGFAHVGLNHEIHEMTRKWESKNPARGADSERKNYSTTNAHSFWLVSAVRHWRR
jgi:hypothetical protein